MQYDLIYNRLVSRAKSRILPGYTEQHHILPRCIGGSDTADNIVFLTPEEHYLAHLLLIRLYPHEPKLVYAARMMTFQNSKVQRVNNKLYGWLKRKHAALVSKKFTGTKQSKEHIEKRAQSLRGRKRPKRTFSYTHSPEVREKMSVKRKGISPWNKGTVQVRVQCPHCTVIGGVSVMKRHHFDHCKNQLA
jgi:hypothetical protein